MNLGGLLTLGGSIAALLAVIGGIAIASLGLITLGVLLYVERRYLSNQFGKEQLARWFERAIADLQSAPPTSPPTALGTVRVAELPLRSNIVTHAKMVIDRDIEVVVLGSPYEQVYFDSQHVVDEPRRGGDASKGPIHEVSVAVRGGAVGHLQELFNNHWNIAEPSDKLLDTPRLPRRPRAWTRTSSTCSVQIVRTLDSMFKPSTGGETCVLESYLRAIHFAKRFIYIENQYFNNDAITEALIEALARNVEVILLLNPAPDMPLYLGWQQKAIRRIAKSLSDKRINPDDRFGVFSAWTHESAQSTGSSKPTLVDNYLHTKSALIDNVWASVGSANLDGASLHSQQYMRQFIGDDLRNTEANVVVYEENATIVPAVDALRRRLWSEHLGFSNAADTALDDAPTKKWVPVWRQLARAKRDALKQDLNNVVAARVLEWPTDSYEKALGICRMFKMFKSHATATAYLRSLLSPKEVPSDVVAEKGPGSYTFTYGAFPDTSVPGSRLASAESAAAISGSAAISDEAATT